MTHAHSKVSFPNGHETERTFRFRQVDTNLCNVLAHTLNNGGTFSIRPATEAEIVEGRVNNVKC